MKVHKFDQARHLQTYTQYVLYRSSGYQTDLHFYEKYGEAK